jgi:hypothetical protein
MRYTVAASLLSLALSLGCYGQETKDATGPAPPTLDQPGAIQPMPIPRQNPVVPPDVRSPQHETGRERPVATTGERARSVEPGESKQEARVELKQGSPTKASKKTRSRGGKR